ncbi:MAG TPA: hypothetical protein VK789_05265 [Bryobacteraceae bacterium]|nr:hypothetical protein [Bryobacteraceae bacterium]
MKRICYLSTAVLMACLLYAQAPAPRPAAPTGGSPSYQRAGQLPARLMDFKVDRDSIQPGETVTFTWQAENPTSVSIDPDIGKVTPRGARQVTPSRTTTYTLTVRGPNNQVLTKEVTVNVAGTTPLPKSEASSAAKEVPRINGHPDLSGVYDFSFGGGGRGAGGRGAAAPAGPVLKEGADKYKVVRAADDSGQYADCMPLAGPQGFSVPYQFQLVESAHTLAILHGYPGTFRVVPMDGGVHSPDPDPTWMGESIGRWEGDTLVVDTVGFNDKTEINGYKHTDKLHIIEKFSRPTYDALQYEATLEDPNVFAKPWVMNRTFTLRSEMSRVDEFVCENNQDYRKLFAK